MAKNKAKSENLLNSIVRLDYLLQEGFTRRQLSDKLNIQYGTLGKIIKGYSKDIKDENHNKIKKFHSDYIICRSNENYFDDDPVIDSQDSDEGAREVAMWLKITIAVGILSLVGLGFVVRYIIGLL
jgi:hypothetical protein